MYGELDRAALGRTPVGWLVLLAFFAVALAVFPLARLAGSGFTSAGILAVYVAAVAGALLAVFGAAWSGRSRAFWGFVGCGVLLRFVGNLSWASVGVFGISGESFPLLVHDAAYALSYAALLAALLVLVRGVVAGLSRLTLVAVADAGCITLSIGLVVWYFALGGTVAGIPGAMDAQATFMFVLRPAADAALMSVALILYTSPRRPVYVPYLAAAFVCLLLADTLHLTGQPVAPYTLGGWPEALRAVGFVLLCIGALRTVGEAEVGGSGEGLGGGRGALSFWFGPLSPALHLCILLGWGAFWGPLTGGVVGGMAVVVGYLAIRSAMISHANRLLRLERERLAVREERSRISDELHDSLKQELNAIPLLLELHEREGKREYLERAISLSRSASEQIKLSITELRDDQNPGSCARAELRRILSDLSQSLPFEVHDILDDSLNSLLPQEISVARRIVSEALWNAAKHSGAENVRVESRLDGDVPALTIRDDGRGFSPEKNRAGYGLDLMRQRAGSVGATLKITGRPGEGTEVRVGFAGKKG